ncbi:MAG TPA: uroporphyrinogen-III synthase [Bacillales bacterium]|nr:uroporphyrinogen-III synthase [Bacillales bacterium]
MKRPLEGKRILVTRAKEQAESLSALIKERGGKPVELPLIAVRKATVAGDIFKQLLAFQWIVFTSANGVRFFFEHLRERHVQLPEEVNVAVVGEKTREVLSDYGREADYVPDNFVAESLAERLKPEIQAGARVLLPRGNLARDVLLDKLKSFGAQVTALTVYETVPETAGRETLIRLLQERAIDVVTFTSSSTVNHFFMLIEEVFDSLQLKDFAFACIGPVTAQTLRKHGIAADILPERYHIRALVESIEDHYLKEGFR